MNRRNFLKGLGVGATTQVKQVNPVANIQRDIKGTVGVVRKYDNAVKGIKKQGNVQMSRRNFFQRGIKNTAKNLATSPKDAKRVFSSATRAITSPVRALGNLNPMNVAEKLNLVKVPKFTNLLKAFNDGLENVEFESYSPPQSARNAARRALNTRKTKPRSQRGGTGVGLARARDLSNGRSLSYSTVKRMKAYFDRHQVDKKGSTWNQYGKGRTAWDLWGGNSGYSWAKKIVRQKEGNK